MIDLKKQEIWFVTGSQHLYGPSTLEKVRANSQEIAQALDASPHIPTRVVFKPVLTTPEAITALCEEASSAPACAGLVLWMHTFSPAKMWIRGLSVLRKPFLHLHTQHNRDVPWATIDMDFMNLNQAAHGDREFGFIATRMRKERKVVVGHWTEASVQEEVGVWARAACAWQDAQGAKIARFGDNMREVAVTEGDKVEAQIRLGYSVSAHAMGSLAASVQSVADAEVERLCREFDDQYELMSCLRPGGERRASLQDAARIELGMRAFLAEGGFKGFTTNFEDLHGLSQLPGLAVQRLMADGYGFGAEGDWKTAALVRAMKVMGAGLPGGTSFMEDYTYHLDPSRSQVLGAHMLEVCASIADTPKPALEIHRLGIGGKDDPPRLVFGTPSGPAINASLIDMGNRFRMIVSVLDVVKPQHALPRLPVARALWEPRPNLKVAAAAWIYAGGAHHAAFSQAAHAGHLEDFTAMAGIEYLCIDEATRIPDFKNQLRWNETSFR
ncbi:L-arabinose isomerase [Geothrix limicola]|uniref:L-arabinose isomerase n=1 Tax=Geothrix limicola TaxID=2927978 RepID=A0ABQ5QAV8_9BACT|nr:L-arabinose isomerase [Geothrix limicola]GLH71762.1 L-arabinose isomerase [Geothrix limicola]